MPCRGPAVPHGNETERKDEGPADPLHRLSYAGNRQYRGHCWRFWQDDQDASVCQCAGGREQRLLARPLEVPCVRCALENKRGRRRCAAWSGDAHPIHGRLRDVPPGERVTVQVIARTPPEKSDWSSAG